jgi:hypothetical protein
MAQAFDAVTAVAVCALASEPLVQIRFYIFVTILMEHGSEALGNHGAEHPAVLKSYVLCFMPFSTL